MVEADLERAEERAELGEKYVLRKKKSFCKSIFNVFRVCLCDLKSKKLIQKQKHRPALKYKMLD